MAGDTPATDGGAAPADPQQPEPAADDASLSAMMEKQGLSLQGLTAEQKKAACDMFRQAMADGVADESEISAIKSKIDGYHKENGAKNDPPPAAPIGGEPPAPPA
jgi:hypothetical protein